MYFCKLGTKVSILYETSKFFSKKTSLYTFNFQLPTFLSTFAPLFHIHTYTHTREEEMRYAIIAAGEGSRLRQEGIAVPKPLIMVNGERLIDRLIRIFTENGATEIVVICNGTYPEVAKHLARRKEEGLPLKYVVKNTQSSMHSLYEIAPMLGKEKFVLTTVDTFFDENLFRDYIKAFSKTEADGMMAVTTFCDDEKPLYVSTDKEGDAISGFHDTKPEGCKYVSAGIYGLNHKAIATLERCVKEGQSRMRNFQRALVAEGIKLTAYPIGKVTDIDHATDIASVQKRIVGIYRAERYSPSSVEKDRAILDASMQQLKAKGYAVSAIREEDVKAEGYLPQAEAYLSMARSKEVLGLLQDRACLNPANAVRYCNQRSYVTTTEARPPLWIKRADQCSEQEDDVVFCPTEADVQRAKNNLHARGINSYVVQPHHEGEHVKFYGVEKTDFFYPSGQETLRHCATEMARKAGLSIYGGDAITGGDGTVSIIDLNDFPSFSPCRKEAAEAIAKRMNIYLANC